MRTIQIANTKTQRRYSIETEATTLGELQDDMTRMGIDFTGMSFTEGISKTQLLGRDSMLPTNVMYHGQPTNNLVMLLTNTTKNIASGAMDRKEAYRLIKEYSLQEAIADGEGVNYTRVKTDVLEEYINDYETATDPTAGDDEEETAETEAKASGVKTAPHANTVNWLYDGIKTMAKENLLFTDDVAVLADLVTDLAAILKETEPKVSDADIDNMIASL